MKTYKIVLITIGILILINLIVFMISAFTDTALIVKIEPLSRAYIFAHGNYREVDDGYYHVTNLNGKNVKTNNILNDLREDGYNKIWISMCEQGNSDYIESYNNGTKIKWGDDVSRVEQSGKIYPLFIGVWIVRLNSGDGNEN